LGLHVQLRLVSPQNFKHFKVKTMHRFYCPEADFSSKHILIIDKDELHHLRDVLRLKKGDEVYLFDGKGREASGNLLTVTSKEANVQIHSVTQFERKDPLIILACAPPKKSKFELIIEKATELGVDDDAMKDDGGAGNTCTPQAIIDAVTAGIANPAAVDCTTCHLERYAPVTLLGSAIGQESQSSLSCGDCHAGIDGSEF